MKKLLNKCQDHDRIFLDHKDANISLFSIPLQISIKYFLILCLNFLVVDLATYPIFYPLDTLLSTFTLYTPGNWWLLFTWLIYIFWFYIGILLLFVSMMTFSNLILSYKNTKKKHSQELCGHYTSLFFETIFYDNHMIHILNSKKKPTLNSLSTQYFASLSWIYHWINKSYNKLLFFIKIMLSSQQTFSSTLQHSHKINYVRIV